MKKIGFVTPWYGRDITGGAEAALRDLTDHLAEKGIALEILTTCVKSFMDDWNADYYEPSLTIEENIPVRRFPVTKRDKAAFDKVNAKLIKGKRLNEQEENIFNKNMVNSQQLYDYMNEHQDEYSCYVFTPYMFGTTYYGCQIAPKKSILIPCFHDEAYVYMHTFYEAFSNVAGMIFLSKPEQELANRVFDLDGTKQAVLGTGIETNLTYDCERFREKFHMHDPFILYAGRKDVGKNVPTLIKYFSQFKNRNPSNLKLVLIGGGEVKIPKNVKNDVIDLGFVDKQDKYDACSAAELLCQPSHNESFSIVIMESWMCKRPTLVSGACAVTKNFVLESNGGLYFDNYFEFEETVQFILQNKEKADAMGKNGCTYVHENFAWDVIVERYTKFFEEISNKEN